MKVKLFSSMFAKLNSLFSFCLLEIAKLQPCRILACQIREIKYKYLGTRKWFLKWKQQETYVCLAPSGCWFSRQKIAPAAALHTSAGEFAKLTVCVERHFEMNLIFQNLSLFILAASVSGQVCIEANLYCNNEFVPHIFKLGSASCACDKASHAGAVKYVNGKVYVCLGSEWRPIQYEQVVVYGTENNPGYSCKDILDKAGQQISNGVYWIRLRGKIVVFVNKS